MTSTSFALSSAVVAQAARFYSLFSPTAAPAAAAELPTTTKSGENSDSSSFTEDPPQDESSVRWTALLSAASTAVVAGKKPRVIKKSARSVKVSKHRRRAEQTHRKAILEEEKGGSYVHFEGAKWPIDHVIAMKETYEHTDKMYLVAWPNAWIPACEYYDSENHQEQGDQEDSSIEAKEENDGMFSVERILDKRTVGKGANKRVEYRVEWKPEWIPAKDVCRAARHDFDELQVSADMAKMAFVK
jgi:hypothetical protein